METVANSPRDPQLWRMAKARVAFKSHLFTYLLVNLLLWSLWAVTDRHNGGLPWPIWSSLFWGLGLTIQGLGTYGFFNRFNWSEREYERLVRERDGR